MESFYLGSAMDWFSLGAGEAPDIPKEEIPTHYIKRALPKIFSCFSLSSK